MNNAQPTPRSYGPFWPLLLVAASLIALLALQLVIAVQIAAQQSAGVVRLREQQAALVPQAAQAAQVEEKLKSMMIDLLHLAQTDDDAQRIVKTHGITYTPPQTPPAVPREAVQPLPARTAATNAMAPR